MNNLHRIGRSALLGLAATLSLSSLAAAQAGEGGQPPSLELALAGQGLATVAPTEILPPIDVPALLVEDQLAADAALAGQPSPFRFGWGHEVEHGLLNSGVWEDLPGGERLWRLRLESPGAWSINLIFDRYVLPEGARLYVHNDAGRVLGAFTSSLNQPHGMFATEPLAGDAVTLEYVEPSDGPMGELRLKQVVHAYRDILGQAEAGAQSLKRTPGSTKSGSCNINVNCPLGASWQDQKRSSARLLMGGVLCSGALINNTANDSRQFFLTANHCYSGNPASWVFQFNYESPTCNGTTGSAQSVTGSALKTKSPSADFCLVEITQAIPASYDVYFSGWSRATTPSTTSTGIHHPGGDIKKICQDTDNVVASSFGGAPCWRVISWEYGVTEGGSSGSPLYDQNKRIIGQLYGGQASCSYLFNDYYGRFDVSWGNGLANFLDPLGTNQVTLDGIFDGQGGINPVTYCTPKTTSAGFQPSIGWAGEPSLATGTFTIDCIGGLSGKGVILFSGTAQNSSPFYGGTLCVGGTVTREPLKLFDSLGYVSYTLPISAAWVGTKRYYQFWGRDPQHPDGTGVLLSNGLEVPYRL